MLPAMRPRCIAMGQIMADRRSLTMIGYVYGGITAAVMLIACLVVTDHISGRLHIDGATYHAHQ
jgi:phage-related holin